MRDGRGNGYHWNGSRKTVSKGVRGVDAGLSQPLTPVQVSEYLGVPIGTLANWRYLGKGPAFLRVGRHVRYRSADLAAWVDQRLCDTGSDPAVGTPRTAS